MSRPGAPQRPTRAQARARVRAGLRIWFRSPPRQHGEVLYGREVGVLELFYDLVYVVLIGRAADHLAEHPNGRGAVDFAIVFGLIWLAWFNGTFWHELHGREDGRSRLNIFLQMGLLALAAVYAAEASGRDGRPFAVTFAVLFTLFTWQWYVVRRIDDNPRYRPTTNRYLAGMVATVAALILSALTEGWVRLAIWAAVVALWVLGGLVLVSVDRTEGFGEGVTASLVERVGLFTIVVLGEVVVGVVTGITGLGHRTTGAIATGMVGLVIGMGLWWNYFDILGRRVPNERGPRLAAWLYGHLPLTMAIAASGGAMVSLIGHATGRRAPMGTTWILAGSVALVLASIAVASAALVTGAFPSGMAHQVAPTFAVAALATVLVAVVRPPSIVLVAVMAVILAAIWARLFVVYLASGGDPQRRGP